MVCWACINVSMIHLYQLLDVHISHMRHNFIKTLPLGSGCSSKRFWMSKSNATQTLARDLFLFAMWCASQSCRHSCCLATCWNVCSVHETKYRVTCKEMTCQTHAMRVQNAIVFFSKPVRELRDIQAISSSFFEFILYGSFDPLST